MASAFTHAIAGLAIGTAFQGRQPPPRYWVLGAVFATLPDLDGDFFGWQNIYSNYTYLLLPEHGNASTVQAAIDTGMLQPERVRRWRKLAAEETLNSRSLAERRARDRAFGKVAKRVIQDKRLRRGE